MTDRLTQRENGFGEAYKYRKGGQRDVLDTVYGYLARGSGFLFGTRERIGDMCGVEPHVVKRALNDKRCPFYVYRVITDRDIGLCVSLNENMEDAFRFMRLHTRTYLTEDSPRFKLRRGDIECLFVLPEQPNLIELIDEEVPY